MAGALLLACADPRPPHAPTTLGQWVWTPKDAQLYREVHAVRPSLQAAVWVGTVAFRDDSLTLQLGHAPLDDSPTSPLVVRFDDSLHPLFATASDSEIAGRLTKRLGPLLAMVDRSAHMPRDVQIDYDVPVRLLPRYASVLAAMRNGALRGRRVWITSLVAHVRNANYGSLFRGVIDGHVVQLFDTGDTFSPAAVEQLARALERANVPFAVGVGTYERVLAGGRQTSHRAWIDHLPQLSMIRGFRGVWVFPAGQRYLSFLPAS